MSKYVKVVGFCFGHDCGFTLGNIYELHNSKDEEFAYDDHEKRNYSIINCVKTQPQDSFPILLQ